MTTQDIDNWLFNGEELVIGEDWEVSEEVEF